MNLPTASYISDLAREAGRLALDHFQRTDGRSVSLKSDFSVVTEADKVVESFITGRIRCDFPGHGVVGEEGADVLAAEGRPVWILDPIDGTANFAASMPYWTVSIGVFREGRPWRGALFLPVTNELYEVDDDGRARWNGAEIRVGPFIEPRRETLQLTTNQHKHLHLRWPGRTLTLGAVAIDAALVARGAAQAVVMRPSLWDVAAAMAILEAAGGRVEWLAGGPVDFPALLADAKHRAPAYMVGAASQQALDLVRETCVSTYRDPRMEDLEHDGLPPVAPA